MSEKSGKFKHEDNKAVDRDSVFTNYQPVTSRLFFQTVLVEFVGVMLFQFIGASSTDPILTPFVNGFALAVLVYLAANISGGHLNPAVTFSCCICGFYPLLHSFLYIVVQFAGAIFGALLMVGLIPGTSIGMGDGAPGCFDATTVDPGLSKAQIFGWEVVMTFVLISTVYACGVAKPGHGSLTPLAVGLSLLACAGTGGKYTGAALNPARVVGPVAIFHCQSLAWIYILAQFTAAVLACSLFITVTGPGPLYPYKLLRAYKGISYREALFTWLNGSLPERYRPRNETTDLGDVDPEANKAF